MATEFFLAFAPWVSTHPFEYWVYPKRHMTSLLKLSQKEMMDLALMLRSTLGGMSKALESPSFTMVFHSSSEKKTPKQIPGHKEVNPKRTQWTGLELGGGIYVSDVSPEAAAQVLGASSRKQLAQLVGIR